MAASGRGRTRGSTRIRAGDSPYPGTLTGWSQATGRDLAALGHEMQWAFEGGETASTCTGTCRRCGGQVTASRAGPLGAVTAASSGQALVTPGPARYLNPCRGRQ